MARRSLLYRKQLEVLGSEPTSYTPVEAAAKVKELVGTRADRSYKGWKKRKSSDHTVELVVSLGIDPKQADQMLRGAISLPKGIGKSRRVVAFCDGPLVDQAKAAGAVDAGADELIDKVQKGWSEFDVAIAHPSMMGKVGKLGRVLGPQGKMPTPKAGTVTPDVIQAVQDFKGGRIEFRNDDGGNVHLPVGKTSFAPGDLGENIEAVVKHLVRIKPPAAKGHYIRGVFLSATRTPSVKISVSA